MRATRSTCRAAATVATLLSLVAAGCSGPSERLDVGMREVASDIVLGSRTPAPRPAVVDDRSVPVALPAIPVPPPASRPPLPPPTPPPPAPTPTPSPVEPCPGLDPLDAPRDEAFRDRATPPAEATYRYRLEGEVSVSGADAVTRQLTGDATRAIEDVVVADDGDLSFTLVSQAGERTTRTGYAAVNTELSDPTGGAVDATGAQEVTTGVYLAYVEASGGPGADVSFHPTAPLKLLEFPAFPGASYRSAGTDPLSGLSMSFTATVGEKVLVNACGDPVQAITVELTEGRLDGPSVNLDFAATYDLATQYGGLPVRESVTSAGREGFDTVARTLRATVNEVPDRAGGGA
ncbi:MAG TPA: hypothetical protein VGA69_09250 [Nitriliruptorales bacterium]